MTSAQPSADPARPARDGVETPSGKGAGDENFPVGSFLLPKRPRPKVAVFYAFARATDDIADNPDLPAEDKIRRLDGFDRALAGDPDALADPAYAKAARVRETMGDTGAIIRHCRDLLVAFKADATKLRYRDWDDLMWYCDHSAAPVGRSLIDLHGCPPAAYPASDALCNALQVINHLQDCRKDYLSLDRVYLPQDWLAETGASVADLERDAATPGVRATLDRCLDETEALLAVARSLPGALTSRRLAMEAGAIIRIAEALCRRLRRGDPVATRIALGKPAFLAFAGLGALRAVFGR